MAGPELIENVTQVDTVLFFLGGWGLQGFSGLHVRLWYRHKLAVPSCSAFGSKSDHALGKCRWLSHNWELRIIQQSSKRSHARPSNICTQHESTYMVKLTSLAWFCLMPLASVGKFLQRWLQFSCWGERIWEPAPGHVVWKSVLRSGVA